VHVDDRDIRPGSKFYDWERKGIPLRIEIGPKDVKEGKITIVRRDLGERNSVPREKARESIERNLKDITENLRSRAWDEMNKKITRTTSVAEASKAIKSGKVVKTGWCGEEKCGKEIEEKTDGNILGIVDENDKCIGCGKDSKNVIFLGKSY
jgi:prolyl-tRNA synthetase